LIRVTGGGITTGTCVLQARIIRLYRIQVRLQCSGLRQQVNRIDSACIDKGTCRVPYRPAMFGKPFPGVRAFLCTDGTIVLVSLFAAPETVLRHFAHEDGSSSCGAGAG